VLAERALTMPLPRDDPLLFGFGGHLARGTLERFRALVASPPAAGPPAAGGHLPLRRSGRP
jgi:hypothetical protein